MIESDTLNFANENENQNEIVIKQNAEDFWKICIIDDDSEVHTVTKLEFLNNEKGKHFDPELVDLFLENFKEIKKIQNNFS